MKSNAVKSYALDLDWSAQTMLPIELNGEELHLEARAYQGTDPHNQAFVLINRTSQAANELPYVRVHSGCVTGDIFHSLLGYAERPTVLQAIVWVLYITIAVAIFVRGGRVHRARRGGAVSSEGAKAP